jgi:PAS domain S-box-containing protein
MPGESTSSAPGGGEALREIAVAALESSGTAIAIADAGVRLTWVNAAFLRLWGYARAEEVLGRSTTGFWADPAAAAQIATAIARDGAWEGELVARLADGRPATFRVSANRFGGGAEPLRLIATFDDVTALRAAQSQLELAQRMAHVGYWAFDVATRAVRWSGETYTITGIAPGAFGGTVDAFLALVHPEDVEGMRRAIERVIGDATPNDLDFRLMRPGNEERTVHGEAEPVLDAEGRVVEVRGVIQDVTERVRLEQQLRQVQKMEAVGSLAGGIAHDFNNILTVILSLGIDVAESLPPGSPARGDVEEIVRTAQRAEGLTRQILAFARKQVAVPVDLDLNATIAGATKLLERLIGEHIAVKLSLAPGLPHVHADPRQLEQVLMNLAVNARDAMAAGGVLAISTFFLPPLDGARNGRVEMVVRDSGTGMDAETLARAFDPFFSTKGPGRGTGLGLAVVHGIVQQCGGTVSIDSAPGRGTAVRIVLPAGAAAVAPVAPGPQVRLVPVSPGRVVLLVEDEEPVRRVAARTLERAGYRVLAVADGEDALRIAAATPRIDLLLTDVVMPGMSGTRLADHLRAARPALPVLYMSGFSRDLPESLAPPPGALLQKPFTPELLAARVGEALAPSVPA